MEEYYFVISSGDAPERILFYKKGAFDSEASYVDSFGIDGVKISSYKFVDGEYTEDF